MTDEGTPADGGGHGRASVRRERAARQRPANPELLRAAAVAPSLATYVEKAGWMSPLYMKLRAASGVAANAAEAPASVNRLRRVRAPEDMGDEGAGWAAESVLNMGCRVILSRCAAVTVARRQWLPLRLRARHGCAHDRSSAPHPL